MEADEALQAETLNQLLAATCRAEGCNKKSRGGKNWKQCPCGLFKLCPAHLSTLQCACLNSPPPLEPSSSNASPNSDNVPPSEPTPIPDASPSSAQQIFNTCPVCELLLVDGDHCNHCAYRGHSNPPPTPDDSSDDSPDDSFSLPNDASLFESLDSAFQSSLEALEEVIETPLNSTHVPLPLLDDSEPDASSKSSGGKCLVCGFHSRTLLSEKCTKKSCQSFVSSSKRPRRPSMRALSYQ